MKCQSFFLGKINLLSAEFAHNVVKALKYMYLSYFFQKTRFDMSCKLSL